MKRLFNIRVIVLMLVFCMLLTTWGCTSQATPEPLPEPTEQVIAEPVDPDVDLEPSSKKIKSIAIALAGPKDDGSWNEAAYSALMEMEKQGYEVAYVEGAYDPIKALPAMREYAKQGYDLIIGHGFQAVEAGHQLAAEYPDSFFIVHTGYLMDNPPPNLAIIDIRTDQTGYIEGVLAALMTETNKIGFVSGLELGELARNAYGFELGLKSVNPDIELFKVFTGDFHDSQGAREAVFSMVDNGVDVINAIGNGVSHGAISAAEEKGVWATGNTWDIRPFAPTKALTTGMFNWNPMWELVIADFESGNYTPKLYWADLANGGHTMTEINESVPKEILDQVEDIKAKVISGEIEIPMQ